MTEYELYSPFATVSFVADLSKRQWAAILAGWLLLWVAVIAVVLYAYTIVLPTHIGFEATLLLGIGLLVLNQ